MFAGFDGPHCTINIDDCIGNLCQSGSTCVDLVQGYRCACLPGYSGQHCSDRVGELCCQYCCRWKLSLLLPYSHNQWERGKGEGHFT